MKQIVHCFLVIFGLALTSAPAYAAPSPSVVISQVQAGAISAPTQEYIALYNNNSQDIDLTGWCLSSKNTSKFGCFTATQMNEKLFLKAHSFAIIMSDSFATAHGATVDSVYVPTNKTSGSLVGSSDKVSLLDASGQVIDMVEWLTALDAGTILQRQVSTIDPSQLVDTDIVTNDFLKTKTLTIPSSGLYEVVTIIDVCPNFDGAQTSIPTGMIIDSQGWCVIAPADTCPNIDGLQTELPLGYLRDGVGDCYLDQCLNLNGLQIEVPEQYRATDYICQRLPRDKILITELLPNPSGDDAGREFIELYNPNDTTISLKNYRLKIGTTFDKIYDFPADLMILPHAYIVPTNSTINYTLVNTASRVQLVDDGDLVIDETSSYTTAKEDVSWAVIDGVWQMTNQPTPANENKPWLDPPVVDDSLTTVTRSDVVPCGEGKYRNPLTNRCRSIVTDASILATCASGVYRNPETNRCRKLTVTATSSLVPCRDDQYRSEATNRCRSLTTAASQLTPCTDSQERNPETNRCRAVSSPAVPAAGFSVEPIADTRKVFTGWWTLGGIGGVVIGYGVWEWRRELAGAARKLSGFLTRGK